MHTGPRISAAILCMGGREVSSLALTSLSCHASSDTRCMGQRTVNTQVSRTTTTVSCTTSAHGHARTMLPWARPSAPVGEGAVNAPCTTRGTLIIPDFRVLGPSKGHTQATSLRSVWRKLARSPSVQPHAWLSPSVPWMNRTLRCSVFECARARTLC